MATGTWRSRRGLQFQFLSYPFPVEKDLRGVSFNAWFECRYNVYVVLH